MPPRPKSRKPEITNALLDALQFVSIVTKSEGAPHETNLLLRGRSVIGFNGILAASCPIDTDIHVYPNAELLVKALSKCNEQYSITQLDQNRLAIKSNKFKAIVPCLNPEMMVPTYPDPAVVSLDNRFREALSAVSVLAQEGAQQVYLASVLLNGASLIATTGKVMLEFWGGWNLPCGIGLPKTFATALSKISKNISKFGCSKSSVTVWFEDESWLRTQIFAEPWPDVGRILNGQANVWPLPSEFYTGIEAIEPFSESGDIYFGKDILRSHADENKGACYECSGIPNGPIFNAKQLKIIQPYVKEIDFDAPEGMLRFVSDSVRGCIAGRSK
jgi:hypothetical protein